MSSPSATDSLEVIVKQLRASTASLDSAWRRRNRYQALPSREALVFIASNLRKILFPNHFASADLMKQDGDEFVAQMLKSTLLALQEQVCCALQYVEDSKQQATETYQQQAGELVQAFARQLPKIQAWIKSDADAAYQGDPSAKSIDEVLICYPGILAISYHRMAHELEQLHLPLIPRILAEIAHANTGIDIHPGAKIGRQFFIDHGTGVVIGETCMIGERVRIYQGVTLGAKSFPVDEKGWLIKGIPRHPQVEDDVVIYAGATILGRVTIGKGSSIGGNVWLTRSVPAGSRMTQAQLQSEVFEGGLGI